MSPNHVKRVATLHTHSLSTCFLQGLTSSGENEETDACHGGVSRTGENSQNRAQMVETKKRQMVETKKKEIIQATFHIVINGP